MGFLSVIPKLQVQPYLTRMHLAQESATMATQARPWLLGELQALQQLLLLIIVTSAQLPPFCLLLLLLCCNLFW
jgi:hypothetical protein